MSLQVNTVPTCGSDKLFSSPASRAYAPHRQHWSRRTALHATNSLLLLLLVLLLHAELLLHEELLLLLLHAEMLLLLLHKELLLL
jgi:hypothetical protein